MSAKRETMEQLGLGGIGVFGFTAPQWIELGSMFEAVTMIFSFFFIIVPTGIWTCIRAYRSIMKCVKDKKERDV